MLRKDWPDGTIELNCCYEHKLVYVKLVAKLKLKKEQSPLSARMSNSCEDVELKLGFLRYQP